MAWLVYDLRNPEDQFEPDPTKKNLVILGMVRKTVQIENANALYAGTGWGATSLLKKLVCTIESSSPCLFLVASTPRKRLHYSSQTRLLTSCSF